VLRITHIRNSTVLLDFDGYRVLTDPWFIRNMAGWPVFARPGLKVEQLPPIHVVAVSHFHPDHWASACARHVARLNPDVQFVGPAGAERRFARAKVQGEDMPAGAVRRYGPVEITSVACDHAQSDAKQVNFVFRWNDAGVYFGGDAKLGDSFSRCGDEHSIDIALLPVGDARICGCKQVMGPEDALEAARRLKARYAVPIHEGGLWPSVPPLYTSRGRAARFERLCRHAIGGPRAVHIRRGEQASFTWEDALYLYGVKPVTGGLAQRFRLLDRLAPG
jgi:L-ascorbate metabolism protein UlaG (beta-lactamase superfamily)